MSHVVDAAGIVGVVGDAHGARSCARGLRALAHRGGSGAGLVVGRGSQLRAVRRADTAWLRDEPALDALTAREAPDETREPTIVLGLRHAVGPAPLGLHETHRRPATGALAVGPAALALSGGLTNRAELRAALLGAGALLRDEGDEELVLQLVAHSPQRTPVNRLVDACWKLRGGFALVLTLPDALVAVRDPHGLRPLWLGAADGRTGVATEDTALRAMGLTPLRPLSAGEMVVITARGVQPVTPFRPTPSVPCGQEALALAREGGAVERGTVWWTRSSLGEALAQAGPVPEADRVVAGLGVGREAEAFAEGVDRPLVRALRVEDDGAVVAVDEAVAGRSVALVAQAGRLDALREQVGALLRAGARQVDVRLTTPPARHPCPYGPRLTAAVDPWPSDVEGLARRLGAASVVWTDTARTRGALPGHDDGAAWCLGCLDGRFPVVPEAVEQLGLFGGAEG